MIRTWTERPDQPDQEAVILAGDQEFLSSLNKPVIMSEWGLQGPVNGFSDIYCEPHPELPSLFGDDRHLCMRLQGLAEFPHALHPWSATPTFTTSVGGNTGGSGSSGGTGDAVTIGGTTYILDTLDSSLPVGSPAYANALWNSLYEAATELAIIANDVGYVAKDAVRLVDDAKKEVRAEVAKLEGKTTVAASVAVPAVAQLPEVTLAPAAAPAKA